MTTFHLVLLILFSLAMEGFFAMMEMAAVSFNKVRLQYFVSKGETWAIWLSRILSNPTRLFGTTLICVNTALLFGSECARRFYTSIGLSPDWAALSQVILVVVFAELSPMFAARRYSEHVARLGTPLLYPISFLLTPVILLLKGVCWALNRLLGIDMTPAQTITREELQKAIEERNETSEFDSVTENLFLLRSKRAVELMLPLDKLKTFSSETPISTVRQALTGAPISFFAVYQGSKKNVVGFCYPRDLVGLQDDDTVSARLRAPWFIGDKTPVFEILRQIRTNNRSVGIIVDESGTASGAIHIDDLMHDIIGQESPAAALSPLFIERSFDSESTIEELNRRYHLNLDPCGCETLEGLMIKKLGHRPVKGESTRVSHYELIMEEAGVVKGKRILIRSLH